MQFLESLFDATSKNNFLSPPFQVVDFLSGKAPLNLTMRLGDHMMLIQLQLSTVNSTAAAAAAAAVAAAAKRSRKAAAATAGTVPAPSASASTSAPSSSSTPPPSSSYKPKLDTRALAEASKNLTQTLKQLSSEVLTTKTAAAAAAAAAASASASGSKTGGARAASSSSSSSSESEVGFFNFSIDLPHEQVLSLSLSSFRHGPFRKTFPHMKSQLGRRRRSNFPLGKQSVALSHLSGSFLAPSSLSLSSLFLILLLLLLPRTYAWSLSFVAVRNSF
jgi:hypothetical protein